MSKFIDMYVLFSMMCWCAKQGVWQVGCTFYLKERKDDNCESSSKGAGIDNEVV